MLLARPQSCRSEATANIGWMGSKADVSSSPPVPVNAQQVHAAASRWCQSQMPQGSASHTHAAVVLIIMYFRLCLAGVDKEASRRPLGPCQ